MEGWYHLQGAPRFLFAFFDGKILKQMADHQYTLLGKEIMHFVNYMEYNNNYIYIWINIVSLMFNIYIYVVVVNPRIQGCSHLSHGNTRKIQAWNAVMANGPKCWLQNSPECSPIPSIDVGKTIIHHPPNHSQMGGLLLFYPHYNYDTLWLFNSSPWYRWPIYRLLPINSMVDLSMANC